jgi:hypothetical protein
MIINPALHSGSISSKHPDINFFFLLFFVIYVSCNLCDDVFEEKKYFSHKITKIGPWRSLRILVCKSRFLPFLELFWVNFCVFGLNTEFVPLTSIKFRIDSVLRPKNAQNSTNKTEKTVQSKTTRSKSPSVSRLRKTALLKC